MDKVKPEQVAGELGDALAAKKRITWNTTFVRQNDNFTKDLASELNKLQTNGHTIFSVVGPTVDKPGGHSCAIIISYT